MKYIMKLLLVIVCLSIVYYGFVKHKKMQEFLKDNGINILLIYNPVNLSTAPNVLRAYESVLKEEGTAFRSLEITIKYQILGCAAQVPSPTCVIRFCSTNRCRNIICLHIICCGRVQNRCGKCSASIQKVSSTCCIPPGDIGSSGSIKSERIRATI